MTAKYCYLFGGEAVNLYKNSGFSFFLSGLNNLTYNAYCYNEAIHHPNELLNELQKWDGFCEITYPEYRAIKDMELKVSEGCERLTV